MYKLAARNLSEVAMSDGVAGLDKIDEPLMTYDLADEVLEAAARVDGVQAVTIGYCATASTSWYCLPY
jgi:dienelactone hydrolase